jgi:hypothetical protein
MLCVREDDAKGWIDATASPRCVQAYEELLTTLRAVPQRVSADGSPDPALVPLAPEALETFKRFVDAWAERVNASDGHHRSMLLKMRGACARLALMHHVVGHAAAGRDFGGPIGRASVEAAVTLTHWFAAEAERAYVAFGASEASRQRDRLVHFVRRRGGSITPRNLHKSNRCRYPNTAAAETALDALVREGHGAWLVTSVAGRPSKAFHLAPEPPPAEGGEGGDND